MLQAPFESLFYRKHNLIRANNIPRRVHWPQWSFKGLLAARHWEAWDKTATYRWPHTYANVSKKCTINSIINIFATVFIWNGPSAAAGYAVWLFVKLPNLLLTALGWHFEITPKRCSFIIICVGSMYDFSPSHENITLFAFVNGLLWLRGNQKKILPCGSRSLDDWERCQSNWTSFCFSSGAVLLLKEHPPEQKL